MPKNKPAIINVPSMNFIMVDGKGDPSVESSHRVILNMLFHHLKDYGGFLEGFLILNNAIIGC